jgi:GNAT superfamily N-acetyltransferase
VNLLQFPETAVPAELRDQVITAQDAAWPRAGQQRSAWPVHDQALDPAVLLLVDEGVVLASLAVLRTRLQHAGGSYDVGGLSAVVTRADRRGRGYGRLLAEQARRIMADTGLDLGLFTCDRPLRDLYERAGWRALPGTVIVGGTPAAPLRSDAPGFDKVAMAAFFSARARAARDRFAHADIALYPGEIDRLW